jgi:hypothetical protein
MVTALGPLTVLLLLGVMISQSGRKAEQPTAVAAVKEVSAPPRFSKVDLSTLAAGGAVPEWTANQGTFRLVEVEGVTVLEVGFEPLAEGRMTWTRLLGTDGVVRVRMRGERTRRNAPRFAVGLAGASNFWFRVVPLEKTVQFVGKEEKVLASAPRESDTERSQWVELKFAAVTDGEGSRLEGRVWYEGDPRPLEPLVSMEVKEQFGFGRAVVAGAPYALKPIYIEALEVGAE